MYETRVVGLNEALGAIQAMLHEVKSKTEEYWQYGGFAVTDERGGLIAFAKMDGPTAVPLRMAIKKAYTAAIWGRDTNKLRERMKDRPWDFQGNFGHDFTVIGGGVAILEPGQEEAPFPISIGAIGVASVGPEDKDEAVALVGLRYIQNALWPSK